MPSPLIELSDLLVRISDDEGVRSLPHRVGGWSDATRRRVLASLPGRGTNLSGTCFAFADALIKRGLVGSAFFSALVGLHEDAPANVRAINAVADRFREAMPEFWEDIGAPAGPSRILYMGIPFNGMGDKRLRTDEEQAEIDETLRQLSAEERVHVVAKAAVSEATLLGTFDAVSPVDIWHFAGHCTREGEIVIHGSRDGRVEVRPEVIANALRSNVAPGGRLRFAVLNACHSVVLARYLVDVGVVEAAIGMNDALGDSPAIAFASQLYRSLANHNGLGHSHRQAKERLLIRSRSASRIPEIVCAEGADPEQIFLY